MRLSFNEIRVRAAKFAADYSNATYEKGETQTFYNDFFGIFGVERRSVARYEEHVKKLDNRSGFIDLFWPKILLVEQKSAGRDLVKAGTQAGEYFDALKETDRPRFQLLCDFQTFQLLDRDTREETAFALADLPKHVEKFGFIMGMEKRSFKDQDPVNIEAAELVGHLHDALEAGGYRLGKIPAKGKDKSTIKTPGISSLALAETPTAFHVTVLPKSSFLVLPEVSSERREYAPIGRVP